MGRPGGGLRCPHARPAVFTLNKLDRPGWWGVWRSGIKEEAAGRGTAAAPNATPAWSATPPSYTARHIAVKLGLPAAGVLPPRLPLRELRCPPRGLIHLGAARRRGCVAPPQDLLCLPCTNLADQAGGAFGAAASRRRPQAGGQPQRRMPRRPGPRHGPAKPSPLHHPADRIQTWHSPRRAYLARARRASLMPSLTPTSWGSALSAAAASRSL